MTIEKISKVLFVAHNDERDRFFQFLQEAGIVEISELAEEGVVRAFPDLRRVDSERLNALVSLCAQIDFAIEFLKPYSPKKSLLSSLKPPERMEIKDLESLAKKYNVTKIVERVTLINREIAEAQNQITKLESSIFALTPWAGLDAPIESLRDTTYVSQILFKIYKLPNERIEQEIANAGDTGVLTLVSQKRAYSYYHLICLRGDRSKYEEALSNLSAEKEPLPDFYGTFAYGLVKLKKEAADHAKKIDRLEDEARVLAADRWRLEALHDYYAIKKEREEAFYHIRASKGVFYLEGWIPEAEISPFVARLKKAFSLVEAIPFPHAEGEKSPILLKNDSTNRPFEMITELYGMPNPKELDPTPLLSPFFVVYFGLCLSDAGYALILIAALLFVIFRFKDTIGKMKVIHLFLWCSVSTLLVGTVTGSWFGDTINYLPEDSIVRTILSLGVAFDPLKQTMGFMVLCIGLGFIQVVFGILIKMYQNARKGNITEALFVQLAWVVFLFSGSALVVQFMSGDVPNSVLTISKVGISTAALSLVVFSHPEYKNPILRILWGIYAVYGCTAFIGDLMSYLRLLALGLSSSIIAIVINLVAKLTVDSIPPVFGVKIGVVFAILILVGGHFFNLVINILGAFVHTTRLQYVEFFTKFYEGGGRPFRPFKLDPKYVLLNQEKIK